MSDAAGRERRLAEALRANLHRRKAQARGAGDTVRDAPAAPAHPPPPAVTPER